MILVCVAWVLAADAACDRSPFNCKLPAEPKDRNRIFNPATQTYDWPIAAGTPLKDGSGNVRGTVVVPAGETLSVKINYGARKVLSDVPHVYAWAALIEPGGRASGWVPEAALEPRALSKMPTVEGKNPGLGDDPQPWRVTGGDPSSIAGLKVAPHFSGDGENGTDYLVRPGNVVNLLYNLPGSGGVSVDTFPLGVTFRRARGVRPLNVLLYPVGTRRPSTHMTFLYGHIADRYGWIAKAALTEVSPGDDAKESQ